MKKIILLLILIVILWLLIGVGFIIDKSKFKDNDILKQTIVIVSESVNRIWRRK